MTTPFLTHREEFRCPSCDGAVPTHHIHSRIPRNSYQTLRVVTLYCEHCNQVWRASLVLDGGLWRLEDAPVLADSRESQRMIDRVRTIKRVA